MYINFSDPEWRLDEEDKMRIRDTLSLYYKRVETEPRLRIAISNLERDLITG